MNNGRARQVWIVVVALGAAATPALADPGTAWLFPVAFHWLIGNLIIGVVEWIGLCLFGASRLRASLMIPANHISGTAGIWLSRGVIPSGLLEGSGVLTKALLASGIALAALCVIGMLVELPFVLLAFRRPRRWGRVLSACACVNIVTSAGVGAYYASMSDHSLAQSFRVVPIDAMELPDGYRVFAIAPDNRTIERFGLDGSERTPVVELSQEQLAFRREHELGGGVSLTATDIDGDGLADLLMQPLPANFPVVPTDGDTPDTIWRDSDDGFRYTVLKSGIGLRGETLHKDAARRHFEDDLAPDFREMDRRDPVVDAGFTGFGLEYRDGRRIGYTMSDPVLGVSATPKAPTVLPGNLLVFELGDVIGPSSYGVFIADLDAHTIAYVGPGRSPVVVFGDPAGD